MIKAIAEGKRVVFIDQVHMTNRSNQNREFSNVHQNIMVTENQMMIQPLYINMAVSKELGLEAYHVYENHINSKTFCELLDGLSSKGPWIGLTDNKTWMYSNYTNLYLRNLNNQILLKNIVARPVLNAIESCFSILKNYFKREAEPILER